MSLYRTNAIVLRTRNLGEADRVLILLSEDFGKFEAVTKGARRGRSRFVGNTLPFNYLKALFFTGKSMDTLSQAELIHPFSQLREDLYKLAYATYWVELIDGFVPEREEVRELFRFLLAAFVVLERTVEPQLLNLAFEIRILNYLGYRPELDHCAGCGEQLAVVRYFSATAGGMVCERCHTSYRDLLPAGPEERDLLLSLITTDLRELAALKPIPSASGGAGLILRSFIEARMERALKSRTFLDSILSEKTQAAAVIHSLPDHSQR